MVPGERPVTLKHRVTGEPLEQPERMPDDPNVEVAAFGQHFQITVGKQTIVLSGFNAWRLFGMLGFILGFALPTRIGKAIKL